MTRILKHFGIGVLGLDEHENKPFSFSDCCSRPLEAHWFLGFAVVLARPKEVFLVQEHWCSGSYHPKPRTLTLNRLVSQSIGILGSRRKMERLGCLEMKRRASSGGFGV